MTIITTKNTNTLRYNLVLHITLQNPNKDFGIHYHNITVMAYYQEKRFVAESYSYMFYQEKNDTTLLKLSFRGQQDMDTLGVEKDLNSEAKHQCAHVEDNNVGSANNNYDIFVRLYLQNTAIPKATFKKNWKVNSEFICDLKKVPLIKSANYFPSTFKTIECDSYLPQVYHAPGLKSKRFVW
ncbi:NDR1/HIN1-like protein 3 [Rosa rugosa]|uniref:NDR1/HIN1-like protein 3 n=1 Tax=Rosa rugosa TaxID=74645 RepID=UPI002B403E46|nr:NDR1/HIN1-like protein 3 [Rosa rugosa]